MISPLLTATTTVRNLRIWNTPNLQTIMQFLLPKNCTGRHSGGSHSYIVTILNNQCPGRTMCLTMTIHTEVVSRKCLEHDPGFDNISQTEGSSSTLSEQRSLRVENRTASRAMRSHSKRPSSSKYSEDNTDRLPS